VFLLSGNRIIVRCGCRSIWKKRGDVKGATGKEIPFFRQDRQDVQDITSEFRNPERKQISLE